MIEKPKTADAQNILGNHVQHLYPSNDGANFGAPYNPLGSFLIPSEYCNGEPIFLPIDGGNDSYPDRDLDCQMALERDFQALIAGAMRQGWREGDVAAALMGLAEANLNLLLGVEP